MVKYSNPIHDGAPWHLVKNAVKYSRCWTTRLLVERFIMARPRTKGPIKNSDGRYMIHVYRKGVKAPVRIYFGDKNRSVFDRKTATEIYSYIDAAVDRGDVETVRNRIAYFRRVGVDSVQGLMWSLDDRPETSDEWLAENNPELYRDIIEDCDYDRNHLDDLDKSLAKLDSKTRDDLIEEHLSTLIEWIGDSDDTAMLRKAHKQIGSILNIESKSKGDPDSDKKLSDCYDVWETFKLRTSSAPSDKHVRQLKGYFQEFVDLTGNPAVNTITKQHLLDWEEYIDHKSKDRGAPSYVRRVFAVRTVLQTAINKTDEKEYPFPQNLERWLRLFSVEKKAPGKEHKIAMSLENFQLLLTKAQELGAIDLDAFANSIKIDPNDGTSKMRKAREIRIKGTKKREGLMWSVVLRLACNVGCDNVDIARLKLNHLRIDDKLPLFAFPRVKVAKQVGEPVERYTPLLPATIAAIRQWVAYEQPASDDLLFRNDIGNQWQDGKLSHSFGRLRKLCKLPQGVWFKSLRNSGPTVAAKSRTPRIIKDDREAFLGHAVNGQSRFYTDGIGEDLLIDMVNVIGREYFDGEQVG